MNQTCGDLLRAQTGEGIFGRRLLYLDVGVIYLNLSGFALSVAAIDEDCSKSHYVHAGDCGRFHVCAQVRQISRQRERQDNRHKPNPLPPVGEQAVGLVHFYGVIYPPLGHGE